MVDNGNPKGVVMGDAVTLQNGTTVSIGCWLDSTRGWRIVADVVRLAWSYGMGHSSIDAAILDAFEYSDLAETWTWFFDDDPDRPSKITLDSGIITVTNVMEVNSTDLFYKPGAVWKFEPNDINDQGGMVDQAIEWLNNYVAPAGYEFGLSGGDFFLQSFKWWQEEM